MKHRRTGTIWAGMRERLVLQCILCAIALAIAMGACLLRFPVTVGIRAAISGAIADTTDLGGIQETLSQLVGAKDAPAAADPTDAIRVDESLLQELERAYDPYGAE